MKKLIVSLLAALAFAGAAHAAGGGIAWDRFPTQKANDLAALQNGAKLFVNYCLNCHAAAFMRYNRMRDIGLTDEQIKSNLMFTTDKVGDLMKVSLNPRDAKEWFGAVPPDLTVIARSRSAAGMGSGADYLYTYLRTYYRDDTKATGWNNLAFPSVGMPHVLWELQGERRPVFDKRVEHGHEVEVFTGRWEQVKPGTMTPQQYDEAVGDLVAFLHWMGEPMRADRIRIGVVVLIFLAVFTVIAWRLNAAFWKDVK
ncbi:cytochrome c1 [Calidifontimicrobium sp. SYSU G02091]|uniref:cytochrome c1 n=1 Tax=Calidifontimicrobium sp. SYSU G02091 TaxID=2926421 RepID=UPI001F53C777|nr:cytochrome c1 [Calidifontimicrobium sp. SYSU G02091]MCI1192951.1 cytochrome c1 [Calidifontimicrobium sp. SYSU G02091]